MLLYNMCCLNLCGLTVYTYFFTVSGCNKIQLVGDGFCNDETNSEICNYDGGDCCLDMNDTNHCSDCTCYFEEFCATGFHPSIGDGLCNDDTNIDKCGYDGGDCCLSNVKRDYCFNCSCFGNGVITSPGFPQNYGNNLDLTWLIQLPLGQFIEINFIEFDLGSLETKCGNTWHEDSLTFSEDNSVIIAKYNCRFHPSSQVVSSGNKMFIRLKTTALITHPGFKLEYRPISK